MGFKIAIFGSRGYPCVYSGYETLVRELAERLVAAGHEVTVYNHRHLFPSKPRTLNGVRLVYLPTFARKNLSQFVHSLQAAVHAALHRFDIVLAVNSANGPFGLLFKLSRKLSAINIDGLEWRRPKWKGWGSRYFYWASRMAVRFYDVIIADCRAMADVYRGEFGAHPVTISYGAHVLKPREPVRLDRRGLASRDYYLIVGRLIPDNNVELMVREFLGSGSRRKLVVVGDVPYRDAYALRLKKMDDPRLAFTGYIRDQEDLAELYQHCYAYLHGHEFGGTNPSLLAALGCGCAVCALDTVFNREVLEDGVYGLLFSKKRGDLASILRWMEDSPKYLEGMRSKSPGRIAGRYSWEGVTSQYLYLFQKMIDSRGARP
jgi:glycosyltransferase involved in cell wall biosynthesis